MIDRIINYRIRKKEGERTLEDEKKDKSCHGRGRTMNVPE
jgi:hypothetical protein